MYDQMHGNLSLEYIFPLFQHSIIPVVSATNLSSIFPFSFLRSQQNCCQQFCCQQICWQYDISPPAARGKAHGAWRFAHSVNCVFALRPALCEFPWTREASAKAFDYLLLNLLGSLEHDIVDAGNNAINILQYTFTNDHVVQ